MLSGSIADNMRPADAKRAIGPSPEGNDDLAASIRIPVLLSGGGKDPISPAAVVAVAAAALPDARIALYADSGHSPFAEEPARFNRELAAFARAATVAGESGVAR
jgi:pimeloyl-ACP methyl ester carboxylesterase